MMLIEIKGMSVPIHKVNMVSYIPIMVNMHFQSEFYDCVEGKLSILLVIIVVMTSIYFLSDKNTLPS